MGLLQNGYRHNLTGKIHGATTLDGANPSVHVYYGHRAAANRNQFAGEAITDDLAAVPNGNRHPSAWIMPRKAGGLASHNMAEGVAGATLNLAEGRNLSATAAGSTPTAQATLQLVVSMQGAATGLATADGNVNAALGMAGSAAGTSTAAGQKNALAWAIGESAGSCSVTLTRYATGRLYGSITPYTELSPQTLAAAVLDAAQAAPIHADVQRVNNYEVIGDGQSGSRWGPA